MFVFVVVVDGTGLENYDNKRGGKSVVVMQCLYRGVCVGAFFCPTSANDSRLNLFSWTRQRLLLLLLMALIDRSIDG